MLCLHMKLSHTRKTEGTLPKNIKRGKELHKVARLKKYTMITHGSLFLSLSHGYENGTYTHTYTHKKPKMLLHYEDRQITQRGSETP